MAAVSKAVAKLKLPDSFKKKSGGGHTAGRGRNAAAAGPAG